MSSGELRERIGFESRILAEDGYGNTESSFVEQFVVSARIMPLKGGERIIADRLSGTQPVIIRVRSSSDTRQITPGWRAIDARAGTVYNITAAANIDEKRKYLDILATSGEAA